MALLHIVVRKDVNCNFQIVDANVQDPCADKLLTTSVLYLEVIIICRRMDMFFMQ